MCLYVDMGAYTMQTSGVSSFFHDVGPGEQTWGVRIGSQFLYPLSQLACPGGFSF